MIEYGVIDVHTVYSHAVLWSRKPLIFNPQNR